MTDDAVDRLVWTGWRAYYGNSRPSTLRHDWEEDALRRLFGSQPMWLLRRLHGLEPRRFEELAEEYGEQE